MTANRKKKPRSTIEMIRSKHFNPEIPSRAVARCCPGPFTFTKVESRQRVGDKIGRTTERPINRRNSFGLQCERKA